MIDSGGPGWNLPKYPQDIVEAVAEAVDQFGAAGILAFFVDAEGTVCGVLFCGPTEGLAFDLRNALYLHRLCGEA